MSKIIKKTINKYKKNKTKINIRISNEYSVIKDTICLVDYIFMYLLLYRKCL